MSNEKQSGVKEFEDFTTVFKVHVVDSFFTIGLPVSWEPYESDRFRAKTQDDKTHISITTWNLNSDVPIDKPFIESRALHLYEKFVTEGGYEPYDDLVVTDEYISKSFKVDEEIQYYLTKLYKVNGSVHQTGFIIRDIGDYNPQMRATLLNIAGTMKIL